MFSIKQIESYRETHQLDKLLYSPLKEKVVVIMFRIYYEY